MSETTLAKNPGNDTMTTLNTKEPAALNVGRDIEARFARQQAARERQERKGPATEAAKPGILAGVLGPVEAKDGRNGKYLRGSFTFTADGVETTVVALVSARAMERAAAHFVEGPVRLYGELRATTFSVIGPALARAGATRTAAKSPVPAPESPAKKRPSSWWFAQNAAKRKAARAA